LSFFEYSEVPHFCYSAKVWHKIFVDQQRTPLFDVLQVLLGALVWAACSYEQPGADG
jgi:hypothetical protein